VAAITGSPAHVDIRPLAKINWTGSSAHPTKKITLVGWAEEPVPSIDEKDFCKKSIHADDIFQANLSLRFEARTDCSSWSIYRALQRINPWPFASYWQTQWGAIVSCSPERLVQLLGKKVDTRPIAGTRPRGLTRI